MRQISQRGSGWGLVSDGSDWEVLDAYCKCTEDSYFSTKETEADETCGKAASRSSVTVSCITPDMLNFSSVTSTVIPNLQEFTTTTLHL